MKNCPKCNTSWLGKPIPKENAQFYSGTHFKREICIDGGYIGIYDGIVAIRCPDCNEEFPRGPGDWERNLFEKYKKVTCLNT